MNRDDKLIKYLKERGAFFDSLTPGELKAYEEYLKFLADNTDRVYYGQIRLDEQANEYDRSHLGFFAVALSLIITGMLANFPVSSSTTRTAQALYLTAITSAAISAGLLFIEIFLVKKAFKVWNEHNSETSAYINSKKWTTPTELEGWMNGHKVKLKTQSPQIIMKLEAILLILSLGSLVGWAVESLLNPNWPRF